MARTYPTSENETMLDQAGALPFSPVRKQSISEQVATSVRDAILGGELRPGDPLPSERELAERFGVNRSSVREALRRLEAWGLIQISHGNSTVVRNFLATAGPALLPFFVAPAGTPDPKVLSDLLDIRAVFLSWTARQAATLGRDGDLGPLTRLVEALEREHAPRTLQELDFDFFQEMVALTGNRVLALLANSIREVYMAWPDLFTPLYQPEVFNPTHHRTALAAIAAGAADQAAEAMEAYAHVARLLLDRMAAQQAPGGTPS